MKKRMLSLALTLALLMALLPATVPASAAAFTPVTGWEMMEKLGAGITFANTTEARPWSWHTEPWEEWYAETGSTLGRDYPRFDERYYPTDTEGAWGQPKIEKWHIQAAAQKGFDSYRMCVTWGEHMDKDLKISKAWLDRIQEIADWCLEYGMNVLINSHHEEELYWYIRDGRYEDAKERLNAIWAQVAERFKDYPESLLFEIMNEPNLQECYDAGTLWPEKSHNWISMPDANGNWGVSQALCDTVNKLNFDALETIRKSGGYNDKRVVVFCVPGADPTALPYIEVPNDPYIMLGTFGYDAFINEQKMPYIQAWLDKGIGFVNKEDQPGELTRNPSAALNRVEYAKQHFGELAEMGVPSFYFTAGTGAPYREAQLIDRLTGEWIHKSLLETYLAAYGKTPGPDVTPPAPAFPYIIQEKILPDEPTWFTVPAREFAAAEKVVVEISGSLSWFQFETQSSTGWEGFPKGHSRVAEESGKIILDIRGLNLRSIGFRTGGNGADAAKVTRVYIDTWEGTPEPTPPPTSGTQAMPYPNVGVTLDGEKVPVQVYGINGNIYLRLSDLAIAVGIYAYWDGAVQLDTSQPAGSSTPGTLPTEPVEATLYPNIKVYLDGTEIPVNVYGIDGSTILGLGDVARALNLNPSWENGTAVLTRAGS
ncbi:MAG: glycoside hydrolase family 5 protein [Oscillospiraceae bacterium]|nr:glycoside hydrolase family 5 protein [Oscillospiraceae bacterium]